MVAAVLNLTGENIIEANSYWSMNVYHPGNVSSARIKGQIRTAYGGEVLATFRMEQPIYEEEQNRTKFTVFLRSSETEKIPVPPEGEFWVYDLLLLPTNGDYRRLVKGTVAIDPGVTDV